jgi:hypothetical protein
MGTLVCKAVRNTGNNNTNEVEPESCFECEAGRIYRELGCDAFTPAIRVICSNYGNNAQCEQVLCKLRKRYTTFDECKTCNLKAAETTKTIFQQVKGLFTDNEFFASFKEIEKAREALRDGKYDTAITNSLASLESTMRIIHEKLEASLPNGKAVSDLYKSTRTLLKIDDIDGEKMVFQLSNSLNGLMVNFGGLRNSLSDAHGRGVMPQATQEYVAELALNVSSSLSTFLVRRFNELNGVLA